MTLSTDTEHDTIWSEVTEDVFRKHVVGLEAQTNAVPIDVQKFKMVDEDRDVSDGKS